MRAKHFDAKRTTVRHTVFILSSSIVWAMNDWFGKVYHGLIIYACGFDLFLVVVSNTQVSLWISLVSDIRMIKNWNIYITVYKRHQGMLTHFALLAFLEGSSLITCGFHFNSHWFRSFAFPLFVARTDELLVTMHAVVLKWCHHRLFIGCTVRYWNG